MGETALETKRIVCNNCRELTNHYLRASYSRSCQMVGDDDGQAWFIAAGGIGPRPEQIEDFVGSRYHEAEESFIQVKTFIWSCAGCDDETFERHYVIAGEEEEHIFFYPERRKRSQIEPQPKRFRMLGPKLQQIYSETIACFNRDHMLLCAIGLRALLEGICKEKGSTEGNLERRIDGLKSFLPSANVIEALHHLRVFGNAAAHELDPLSHEDTARAIELVEDLLNFLYELDYKASQVRIVANKGQAKSGLVH